MCSTILFHLKGKFVLNFFRAFNSALFELYLAKVKEGKGEREADWER